MPPKVSIALLSWNHKDFIEDAIRSIAQQSFKDFEIVYLDNISSDNTYECAVNAFEKYNLKYISFKNTRPEGASDNLNFLISKSKGKYITILSGDDWWDVNNLQKKVEYYDAHPDIGLLYSGGYMYYDDTKKYELVDTSHFRRGDVYNELVKTNFVFGIGNFVKKSVYEELGVYDSASPIEDWDMWIRIASKYKVDFIDEPLVYYRRHSSSISSDMSWINKNELLILMKNQHVLPDNTTLDAKYLEYFWSLYAKRFAKKNKLTLLKHFLAMVLNRDKFMRNSAKQYLIRTLSNLNKQH